jgi:hypothetical protein
MRSRSNISLATGVAARGYSAPRCAQSVWDRAFLSVTDVELDTPHEMSGTITLIMDTSCGHRFPGQEAEAISQLPAMLAPREGNPSGHLHGRSGR